MNLVAIAPRLLLNEAGDGVRDIVDIKVCFLSSRPLTATFIEMSGVADGLECYL